MRFSLPAFFLLSAQALNFAHKELNKEEIAKDTNAKTLFDGKAGVRMDTMELMVPIVPELTSHFDLKVSSRHNWSSMQAKVLYVSATGACVAFIALIYWSRGSVTVMAIVSFVLSLSLMSNTIRNIYVAENFRYPQFLTSCHQVSTVCAAFTFLQVRQATTGEKITYPTIASLMKGLFPVALFISLSVGCSNVALSYTTTHFYEMLSPMNCLVTFTLGALLGRSTSFKLLPPVLLVMCGLPLVVTGEIGASLYGLIFIGLGIFFRSMKAQMMSLLMSNGEMSQTFSPVELSCWSASCSFFITMAWSLMAEGQAPYQAMTATTIRPLLLSCVNATVLTMSGMFVVKEVGPVAQQIIGELKGVLATLGAVAAFGEVVTIQQMVAYGLVVIGVQWYNRTDLQVRQEKAEAEKLGQQQQQSEKA